MKINGKLSVLFAAVCFIGIISASCGQSEPPDTPDVAEMGISSPAFEYGGVIPVKYTCEGEDIAPELKWTDAPEGTVSFALIVDDPDAPSGTFTHWVVYNIPNAIIDFPEGVRVHTEQTDGAVTGKNDFGRTGYGGPCPPKGSKHRYNFTIYALDKTLSLPDGATRSQLLSAMEGSILAKGTLTGTFSR